VKAALVALALGLAALGAAAVRSAPAAGRGAEGGELAPASRDAAVETVQRFLAVFRHLHASGGDARFAERMPADPPVVEEAMADVAFTRHQGRIEEPALVRVEVREVRAAGVDRAEVATKEYWVTRSSAVTPGGPAGPTVPSVVQIRYLVRRDSGGWRVADWALDTGPPGGRGTEAR